MKKILCSLTIGIAALFSVFADDPQPMPKGISANLQKNQHALLKATVIQVVENKDRNGVVAIYETLLMGAKLVSSSVLVRDGNTWTKKQKTDVKFTKFQKNENDETIFIVGLDHETLTDDGSVFHTIVDFFTDDKPCLLVWPIGIEKMKLGNRDIRMKKFTVDPKVAAAYYAQKAKK